jgi:hypothetical protein
VHLPLIGPASARRWTGTPLNARTVAAAAALLTGCALMPVTAAAAAAPALKVVAVGDSYASGEGAIGAGWTNATCHRSSLAGPQDAAARLDTLRPTSFTSLACSGAMTASLLGSGGQLSLIPAFPVDALTMSIGGNDIGFAGIVLTCLAVDDCTTLDASVTAGLTTLSARLATVFAAVPGNVGNVFVTEYPDPTTGVFGQICGSVLAPAFQGLETISPAEAAWASSRVVAGLNSTLATAVLAANARPGPHPVFRFVSGISARFAGHGYCTGGGSPAPWALPNPRFIATPVDSLTSQNDLGGVMHPNDLGQRAIGEALYEATRFLTAVIAPVPDHPVPDVRGDTATQARSALAAAGLAVDQRTVVDPTCERVGLVISQSPAAGTMLNAADTVLISVGTRPQTPCP